MPDSLMRAAAARPEMHTRSAEGRSDILMRGATAGANSYDPATRTFEAVIATSAPVRRRSHLEVLDLAGVDLPESLPIQIDHRTDVRASVGRMTDLRIEGGQLLGTGRLSSDPEVEWIGRRIEDGTLGAMSVGFRVARWRKGRDGAGAVLRTAIRWEPVEASFVVDPADRLARIRSRDRDELESDEQDVDDREETAEMRTIRRAAEAMNILGDDLPNDVDHARAAALDEIRRRGAPATVRNRHNETSLDNPVVYNRAAVDSITARMVGEDAQGQARALQAMEWDEFHRAHLRRRGVSTTGLSRAEIIVRALTTSDMPLIAGEAFNQSIRRTYEAAASPILMLFGLRTVPDFRPWRDVLVDWTTLSVDKVNEHGEFKSSYVSDGGETYSIYTVGGITGVTRQLYVNGAQAMGSLSRMQGQRLAADVADRAVAFLEQGSGAGPKMSDGKTVFHADRGNAGSGTNISGPELNLDPKSFFDKLWKIRGSMPRRKGAGNVMIGALPKYWLVPSEFEHYAARATSVVNASQVIDVNPLAGKLEVVTEPRLNGLRSYLVVPPAVMEGMVKVSLDGASGPMTESRWGFEVDALQFKIRLDIGFGFVEWRSWTRMDHVNPTA